jgi:glycosyltransferase involved in cell wall biosynthesis
MARSDLLVSVIMPLRHDAPIIAQVVAETSTVLSENYTHHEIILVDDGSEDDTVTAARSILASVPCVRLIQLSRYFGREAAILAGLETAIGDCIAILIPETDPPALVPKMVARCREIDGIVSGVDARGDQTGPLRQLLKRLFHAYMRRSLKAELLPGATDFRVLSRPVVNALTQFRESYWQLRLLSTAIGYRRAVFRYTPLSRTGRKDDSTLLDDVNEAVDMIITHSRQPLRLVSWLGWLAGFLNVLYVIYAGLIYLFKEDVAPGWTSLSIEQGVMFFFIFSILALLCEYVGRILEESRGRPLYFVCDEKSSSVLLLDVERPNIVKESE